MTHVLVGVDGSEHSKKALRRAMEEAKLREATLEVVYVFEPPRRSLAEELIGRPYGLASVGRQPISPDEPAHHPPDPVKAARADALERLGAFVEDVVGDMDGPEPRLNPIPGEHPAEALIAETRDADLLVIGTRGLGGFAGMLVGSVAHQCIQHAHCPLLVLPPNDD